MAKANASSPQIAAPVSSTGKITYLIEDTAPPYVAGVKVGDRKEIELTEVQARSELLAGHISPKPVPSSAVRNND